MKTFYLALATALVLGASPAFARGHGSSSHHSSSSGGSVHVKGHVTKSGTYVAPHVRSAPNHSKYDNWSTKGNYNPYTGKGGTKEPYSK